MSRVLVTADWHRTDNPRDAYRRGWQRVLRGIVRHYECSTVLVLGDLTEAKDRHRAQLVNEIVSDIAELRRLARVVVLMGNHDGPVESDPFFLFLNQLDVQFVSVPTALPVEGIGPCLFLPHTREPGWWADMISPPLHSPWPWIFAHATFAGARGDNGRELTGVSTSIFAPGARVIAGDVHVPQRVGPVTYVGSPYPIDFGDDARYRVLVIDDDRLISVPYHGPRKVLLEIRSLADIRDAELRAGDVVKTRVHVDHNRVANWGETRRLVADAVAARGATPYAVVPIVLAGEQVTRAGTARYRVSDEEVVRAYGRRANLAPEVIEAGVRMIGEYS